MSREFIYNPETYLPNRAFGRVLKIGFQKYVFKFGFVPKINHPNPTSVKEVGFGLDQWGEEDAHRDALYPLADFQRAIKAAAQIIFRLPA